MKTAVVLFTRDLRVHDNPALAGAAEQASHVVPLFVHDPAFAGCGAARRRFLDESLADLDRSLTRLGARLVVRTGDTVDETVALARHASAEWVFVSEDASAFAERRLTRLRQGLGPAGVAVQACPGVTVVPLGDLHPDGRDHYRVFTPFHRRWSGASLRGVLPVPRRLPGIEGLSQTAPAPITPRADSAFPGGETAGRSRLRRWISEGLAGYDTMRDALVAAGTSRLSPYLHFGCLSPLELVHAVRQAGTAPEFARQLAWREFFHQLLAANPDLPRDDLRPGATWVDDPRGLAAWREGRTGYPVVDAAMRQLAAECFMPNRARLIVASFLTRTLGVDWRHGAAHFSAHLVDADVANNVGGWQWAAGTGANQRPGRSLSAVRQGQRFDPNGAYVRRYVPELRAAPGRAVHEPWLLSRTLRPGYPAPIVEPGARRR